MTICLNVAVEDEDPKIIADFLVAKTGLPKSRIKDALIKGALWIKKPGYKNKRVRRAKTVLHEKEIVLFTYDPTVLALELPEPILVKDYGNFSLWDKPAGMLSQGTKFGDHCAILRKVELHYKSKRQVFLVHRLDKEASGIFLVAHNKKAAAKLGDLFKNREIQKTYLVEAHGNLGEPGKSFKIDSPLDGKEAITSYQPLSYSESKKRSVAQVQIKTGRLHQIRKHFASIGHPIVGDILYGKPARDEKKMMLRAIKLEFTCPFSGKLISHQLDGF